MNRLIRNPKSGIRNQSGFSYIALLAAITIIGITLGAAAKSWHNVIMREKEEELLFRGDQYRAAIQQYYYALPGRNQFPPSIEDLLKDSRTPAGKRYLRQQWPDPITGKDFTEIRDQLSNRIIGVCSGSEKEPIKQSNFPDEDSDFEGKKKYNDWKFVFNPPVIQTTVPAGAEGGGGPHRARVFPGMPPRTPTTPALPGTTH